MQLDTFYQEVVPTLVAEGWVITSATRYEPTTMAGTAPSGKAFSFTCRDNVVTLAIGTRTKTLSRGKETWLSPADCLAAFREVYNLYPANQR